MNWTKSKWMALSVAVVVIGAATFWSVKRHRQAAASAAEAEKIATTVEHVRAVNTQFPDAMVQAKSLIMAAMVQKKIPAAENWCDTLNAGGALWPVTPTNTVFALNPSMAGQVYRRGLPGDVVVFFEASKAGWNQAGGSELLARRPGGVAVAFMDGRALVVPPDQIASLRWNP